MQLRGTQEGTNLKVESKEGPKSEAVAQGEFKREDAESR